MIDDASGRQERGWGQERGWVILLPSELLSLTSHSEVLPRVDECDIFEIVVTFSSEKLLKVQIAFESLKIVV